MHIEAIVVEGGYAVSSDPDRPQHGRSDQPEPDAQPARRAPIGSVLAAAREAKGMSIEDVAATTRIRAALVHAIERDDFAACGGAFYARAHLRSIARVVDADAEALAREFDRSEGPVVPAADELGAAAAFRPPPAAATRRHAPRWAAAAVVVLLVLVAVLVGRWVTGGSGGSSGRDNDAQPSATPTSAAPSPTRSAAPTPTPSPTPVPSGVQVLVQDTGERSWISVTSSAGTQVYQGVLESGAAMRFSDPAHLTLRFGNAPGVTVSVNGKAPGAPCPQTVCTVQFTRASAAPG